MRIKILGLTALSVAVTLILCSCAPIVEDAPQSITVYATFYPIYALAAMIAQDIPDLELHCLVQPQDGCLRDYEMSDWDLYLLAYSANAVFAGGSGLESFSDTLQTLAQEQLALVEVLSGLTLYQENEELGDDSTHFDGGNPHPYMSVDGAMKIVENIAGAFAVLDQRYAEQYMENLDATLSALAALKDENEKQTLVCIGKRAAVLNEVLIYVAQDYQMEIAVTIRRESASNLYEDELENCLNALRESGAEVVLIEQQAPKALVDALETAGYTVARLDILSTRSESDGSQGYFEAQRMNARALAEACVRREDTD